MPFLLLPIEHKFKTSMSMTIILFAKVRYYTVIFQYNHYEDYLATLKKAKNSPSRKQQYVIPLIEIS